MLIRWTAAGNRLERLPLDTPSTEKGYGPQLSVDAPRDFSRVPRMLRAPFPPIPIPKALYGTSFYVGYIVSERGSIERVSMIVADVPAYTRDLLNEVRRATFRPAQKEDGTPTRGYYQMSTAFPPRAP